MTKEPTEKAAATIAPWDMKNQKTSYSFQKKLGENILKCEGLSGMEDERQFVIRIQNNLFNVCTHLATDQSQTPLYPSAYLADGEIAQLEERIDRLMKALPERQGFILPGGTPAAAQAHICRTVCRRAERRIAALAETAQIGPEMQQYVNRLSDYLFVLAKIINFNAGVSEIIWQNICK